MPSSEERIDVDLLLVDDDSALLEQLEEFFTRAGYRVVACSDGEAARQMIDRREFDVAVVDLHLPGVGGEELLKQLKAGGECEAVMLTGDRDVESAVAAMKLGARDYLTKPIRLKELEAIVHQAAASARVHRENRRLREVLRREGASPSVEIVGESPTMQEVFRLIARAGPTEKPILIEGESGTGKELIARALHSASKRADRALVTINCAALPETLLESELFGYEKGAFTGASGSKQGLFEVADGGTLFIDEIGELAGSLQAKLLRVLEDGTLRRLGSVKERRVRVRLLAATNREMAEEVKAGRFREDLYYRINVLTIHAPPLRLRPGDLRLLVERFVGPGWKLDPDFIPTLQRYTWPGNVRQLQNAIERAKILADDDRLSAGDLPPEVLEGADARPENRDLDAADLETVMKCHVLRTYERHQKNKARTARALGIGRRSLYRLLDKYGLGDGGVLAAADDESDGTDVD